MLQKVSKQAAANVDLFDSLAIGATFTIHALSTFRLIERYSKYDAERAQSCTDGRVWHLEQTEASGANVVLVPEGARSAVPYAVEGGAQ